MNGQDNLIANHSFREIFGGPRLAKMLQGPIDQRPISIHQLLDLSWVVELKCSYLFCQRRTVRGTCRIES